jgi:glyoxylase-like metal-dependent hydrolase (beta-lactamase superfamily II)
MQIIQESENLCRLTRFGLFNCFLVKEGQGCTLIDTNVWGSAKLILRASRDLGSPIRRTLLTHAHFDHVASLDELVTELPSAETGIGARESRFLEGDLALEAGETGKKLFGFLRVTTKVTTKLKDGEEVGSLRAISCPGHTPGHFAYIDRRDATLFAGDSFITQRGVVAAGMFIWTFPMPWLFSWNAVLSAPSARKLLELRPRRLCAGHGESVVWPDAAMNRAVAVALKQHPG